MVNVEESGFFNLLNKYELLQFWNSDILSKIESKNEWKKSLKKAVSSLAWNNDWSLIKKDYSLRHFEYK